MTESTDHSMETMHVCLPSPKNPSTVGLLCLFPPQKLFFWIKATEQEPDLLWLKQALQTKTAPLRARLANEKHHDELTSQRPRLENGIICRLEQPMATRIQQLQRRVAPSTLPPTILAACYATPLAGHAGVCSQDLMAEGSQRDSGGLR